MKHVFVVSIGPVQDFIASARRSRDLWFGSWLLSELAKAAALKIIESNGNQENYLIFPSPKNIGELKPESEFNAPNKLLAVIESSPVELGEAVEITVRERLMEIRDGAFQRVAVRDFYQIVAQNQVDDLVEFYWASAQMPTEDRYEEARKLAEKSLSARKTTRDFKLVTWGSNAPKSSLDGQRESVIHDDVFEKYQKQPEKLRKMFGVGPAERLCGVGLLKRHGQRGKDNRVYSTSHVAAIPLIQSMHNKPGAGEAAQAYFQALEGDQIGFDLSDHSGVPQEDKVFGWYDGRLLFEERFLDFLGDETKRQKARDALSSLLKTVTDGKRPMPYYALLHADGDRMGKAIDGLKTPDEHRRLSQKLAEFAKEVGPLVNHNHSGSLVYSGGDDVLAFVPLHTVLSCAEGLAQLFHHKLAEFTVNEAGRTVSPTLSVGIAVGHHLDPLSETLELARKAEKAAKKAGRNALAVTVSKRSGSDTTIVGQWGTVNARLNLFVALHRLDAIPDGAAYELRKLALELNEAQHLAQKSSFLAGIRAEAARILARKRAEGGTKELGPKIREAIEDLMNSKTLSVQAIAEELIVAKEFARAEDLAMLPKPTSTDLEPMIEEIKKHGGRHENLGD